MQEENDLRYMLSESKRFNERAVLIFRYNDKILINRELSSDNWQAVLPGGAVKFDESGLEAARREATEETGLNISDLEYAGMIEYFYKINQIRYHQLNLVYRYEVCTTQFQQLSHIDYQLVDLPKGTNLEWADISKAREHLRPEGLDKMLTTKTPIQHIVTRID